MRGLIFTISGFIRCGILISAIGAICTFIGLFRRKFRTIGTAAALASVTACPLSTSDAAAERLSVVVGDLRNSNRQT